MNGMNELKHRLDLIDAKEANLNYSLQRVFKHSDTNNVPKNAGDIVVTQMPYRV